MWAKNLHCQRTLWLTCASLSTLKKHVIFFPSTILGCGGLRGGVWGGGSRCRLNIMMSITWCPSPMASGVFDLKQRCAEWSLCDIKVTRERFESIRIRLLFYRSCGTLMSHSDDSVQRCFKLNTPVVYRPNIWQFGKCAGEGWAHSELRESRGERRLKRKPIYIQTSRRKLHIRVNQIKRFIAQP